MSFNVRSVLVIAKTLTYMTVMGPLARAYERAPAPAPASQETLPNRVKKTASPLNEAAKEAENF